MNTLTHFNISNDIYFNFTEQLIFTSNVNFFKNKYNPIIFIIIITEV